MWESGTLSVPVSDGRRPAVRPEAASEREADADPRHARVHDFENLTEAGRARQPRVVLLAEDRSVVQQIEDVEIDSQLRSAEDELLLLSKPDAASRYFGTTGADPLLAT